MFIQRFSNIFKEVLIRLAKWVIADTKKPLSFNQINFDKNTFNTLSSVIWSSSGADWAGLNKQ